MARRIREEYIEDEPVVTRRRVITERHVGGGPVGFGMNPVGLVVALLVVVLLLALLFGVR